MDMDRRSRVQLSVRLLARLDGGCTYCYAYLRYGTVHGSYGLFSCSFHGAEWLALHEYQAVIAWEEHK